MKLISSFLCSVALLFSVAAYAAPEAPVNINTADVETLAQLDGIGTKKAEAIVAWRDANGEFVSLDQLVEVRGIGEATIESNRDHMTLN
ncbi:helix-hairpin-helix domain-containing protein [Marinimicrobium sp. LS-A18]|uniref:ComEA family DNA-binding protein n=1 Tax=Marinimicrobium sp. LS-A18 TaxID=1381596 RepID=UPI00046476B9|nr:helix-hairpin-helix domain-containing protein [Marinimicrobium sp. LS-A18]